MTLKHYILAAIFYPLWLLAGGVATWSIYALTTGRMTTSQFMASLSPTWVMISGVIAGTVVAFVAGHWWYGEGHLRFFAPGLLIGLAMGAIAGAIVWPVTR